MEKVTLYIPCFNASEYLKMSLEAVLNQTYPIDEILIVDDGSIDNTARIANQFPVKVISHGRNRGLAAARNSAFREARNEFVAALDADCIAKPNWLEELMKNFKDKDTAGAGGRLVEKYTTTLADQWRAQHLPQQWGERDVEDPPFLFGCNTVMKKSIISAVGLYNERFETNYEDVNISKKLLEKGFRLIYSSNAVVEHLRKDTLRSVLSACWRWHSYNHLDSNKLDKPDRRIFAHFGRLQRLALFFLRSDFKKRQFKMMLIDIGSIFYLSWLSFLDCFKRKKINE